MKKRLKILLIVLGSAIGIGVLASPWRFWLLGAIRGERSYKGWPTCYWSHETSAYFRGDFTPKPAVLNGDPDTSPVLLDLAKDSDPVVRIEAAERLAWINQDDEGILHEAVAALIEALETPDQNVRCRAAVVLGWIGPRAKAAIPALRQAGKEGPDNVFLGTTDAINRIDPDSGDK